MKFLRISLKYISLLILMLLSALSYLPSYSIYVIEEQGDNPLKRYIYLMTIVTLLLSLNIKEIKRVEFIRNYFRWMVFAVFLGSILYYTLISDSYIEEARNILIAFVFLLIGYNAKLNKSQLLCLLLTYTSIVVYCSFLQIIMNNGSLILSAQYVQYGKNSLGAMLVTTSIALFCFFIIENRMIFKIITFVLLSISVVSVVFLRARTAIISIFVIGGYLAFKRFYQGTPKSKIITMIIIIALIMTCYNYIDLFGNLVYESITMGHEDDISAGRISRNYFAIELVSEYSLFGNLEAGLTYDWIHNYLLRQLSSYGFIGSLPLLVLYIYIVFYEIRNVVKQRISIETIGFFTFFPIIIISLSEPTFPYAPGTSVILAFVLLGDSICKVHLRKEI